MIESMGTAASLAVPQSTSGPRRTLKSRERTAEDRPDTERPVHHPTLSALCITDFGDTGAIALALPQFKPCRVDVHTVSPLVRLAKISFEQYFLHKVGTGDCDPYYEQWMLSLVGLKRTADDSKTCQNKFYS